MEYFFSSIKSIDQIGKPINFLIRKEDSFKTVFGGFMTLIILGSYIFFFILFGSDFFMKTNPNVIFQSYEKKDYSLYSLDDINKFFLGWRINDFYREYNISDYFDFQLIHRAYNLKESLDPDINYLNLTKCSNSSNQNISEFEGSTNYNLSKIMCYDNNNKLNGSHVKIGGYWDSNYLNTLLIKLTPKKFINQTFTKEDLLKNNFTHKEFFKSFYENQIFIEFLINVNVFDVNDYEDPIKNSIVSISELLNERMLKSDEIILSETQVETDRGILFEDMKNETSFGFLKKNSYIGFLQNDPFESDFSNSNTDYFQMEIFFGKQTSKYSRKYMKFQELMGNISGFMELIKFFIGIICTIYGDFKLAKLLTNKMIHLIPKITNLNQNSIKPNFDFKIDKINQIDPKNKYYSFEIDSKSHISINNKKDEKPIIQTDPISNNQFKNNTIFNHKKIDNITNNIHDHKIDKEDLEKLKILKNKTLINYSICSYYFGKIKDKSNQSLSNIQVSNLINEKIFKKLDIINYLRLTNTIELMKILLFEKNHINFMDYLSKRMYFIDHYEKEKKMIMNEFLNIFDYEDESIPNNINHIIENPEDNKINKKIINMIENLLI